MTNNVTNPVGLLIKSSFATLDSQWQESVYKSLNQRCRSILIRALNISDLKTQTVNAGSYTADVADRVFEDVTDILEKIEFAKELAAKGDSPLFEEDGSPTSGFVSFIKQIMNIFGRKGEKDLKKALKGLEGYDASNSTPAQVIERANARLQKLNSQREFLENRLNNEEINDKAELEKTRKKLEKCVHKISLLEIDLAHLNEMAPIFGAEIDSQEISEQERTEDALLLARLNRIRDVSDESDLEALDSSTDESLNSSWDSDSSDEDYGLMQPGVSRFQGFGPAPKVEPTQLETSIFDTLEEEVAYTRPNTEMQLRVTQWLYADKIDERINDFEERFKSELRQEVQRHDVDYITLRERMLNTLRHSTEVCIERTERDLYSTEAYIHLAALRKFSEKIKNWD